MRCKKCGGKNTVILSRDIVFETYAGNFYDIFYYCEDCDEGIEERVWVL